jgi:hypothetical protein
MEYDRTADIPIRHRLTDYVCTVSYSERDAEFHFVSARYATPKNERTPANGFDLYLRILREPALRATLFEALLQSSTHKLAELREQAIEERAKNYGFAAGFIALCALGYALYRLTLLLANGVGYSTAEAITYLPAFFAFLIIFPVQQFVGAWYKRRYCIQNSHRFESFTTNAGTEVTWCKRCGFRLSEKAKPGASTRGEP